MSADNWAECPSCRVDVVAAKARQRDEAVAAYGKIPSDDWHALDAKAREPFETRYEFREDYEIYTDPVSGIISIKYRGQCTRCGARAVFDTTFPVLKTDGQRAVTP